MELLKYLKADWQSTTLDKQLPSLVMLLRLLVVNYSFRIIFRMRLANFLGRKNGVLRLGLVISVLLYWMNFRRGVDINIHAMIGEGLRMPHPIGIVIGADVRIGRCAHILQNTTIGGTGGKVRDVGDEKQTMPWIGDFVLIGAGAALLGPIRIGNHAQIGANAVVLSDVKDETLAVGIPAKNRELKGLKTLLADLQN
jgi:serine O-acetyltransferase